MTLLLIDGTVLAGIMIHHEIGIYFKSTYRISRVDHDFFEGFE
jgi:restriction endonuclease Mrr